MGQYLQEIKQNVHGTIVITITIALNNNAYESVCHTFNFEVLCYYNDCPSIYSNADIKHLSRDYAIEWLEDESAVWDIQIDTKKY